MALETIKLCVAYRLDGKVLDFLPTDSELLSRCEPVYIEIAGLDEIHRKGERICRPATESTGVCEKNRGTQPAPSSRSSRHSGQPARRPFAFDRETAPPKHVAIIMDGNGRWARERGLPRLAGHEAGSKSIERCVQACLDTGVQYLTLYAFSSENWKRPALEVNGLMLLLENFLNQKRDEMVREGIRLHHIGRIRELPSVCQRKLRRVYGGHSIKYQTPLHPCAQLQRTTRRFLTPSSRSRGTPQRENWTQVPSRLRSSSHA
jgi:hypothetical protein